MDLLVLVFAALVVAWALVGLWRLRRRVDHELGQLGPPLVPKVPGSATASWSQYDAVDAELERALADARRVQRARRARAQRLRKARS